MPVSSAETAHTKSTKIAPIWLSREKMLAPLTQEETLHQNVALCLIEAEDEKGGRKVGEGRAPSTPILQTGKLNSWRRRRNEQQKNREKRIVRKKQEVRDDDRGGAGTEKKEPIPKLGPWGTYILIIVTTFDQEQQGRMSQSREKRPTEALWSEYSR